MRNLRFLKSALIGGASLLALATGAEADEFNIPAGDLKVALDSFAAQTGLNLIVSDEAIRGAHTTGAKGDFSASVALTRILQGTGLSPRRTSYGAVAIVQAPAERAVKTTTVEGMPVRVAAARAAGIESVVVTSSKIKGDIQTVPIAITALSQEQLTSRQIAGGPDLVKEVPNLTFTKTNFTGYSIQIRGIGTQAISVTTDPAVAVALNDTPFIRNHFFEQEFYDVGQVEVLRGPQGTLYGRNATAGVVNIVSAKPTDQFEAMLSADIGNYHNRRYEGMVNIPIIDDRFDLRIAGEWTKRDGYTTNTVTGDPVDGRDLWSSRVTLGWKPLPSMQAYLVWEHFSESDDRMRTAKQLCHRDNGVSNVLGANVTDPQIVGSFEYLAFTITRGTLSQGCLPDGLYNKGDPSHGDYGSFGVPYGYSLPIVEAGFTATPVGYSGGLNATIDPYARPNQSTNLREIETQINPRYTARNDTLELNVDYNVTPSLTFTSQTGYNNDFLWSTEDYNRFNTTPDIFNVMVCGGGPCSHDLRVPSLIVPDGNYRCNDGSVLSTPTCASGPSRQTGYFCDPQLGCSTRLVAEDLSNEHAWQLSQEFRLSSNSTGPLNFSVGGNYMHYETVEDYYVFSNAFTLLAASAGQFGGAEGRDTLWVPGVTDNSSCLKADGRGEAGYQYNDPNNATGLLGAACYYIDPNPLASLNGQGHAYFRSQNPYVLNSYAGFGEVYYDIASTLKLTGGLRWTDDEKHFIDIPSMLLVEGYGYATTGMVDQKWNQMTGRLAANWTPKLDFTDQTLVYGSFAHGYKAGGANPPGASLTSYFGADQHGVPIHPLTFKPEFVDAYELGSKNTLLDGGLTLNGDVFFYNYKGYQISRIVDRTSINDNFDATVKGAELEAMYEPLPGLKFNFAGGYEDTRIKDGQSSIDLIDRTDSANHPGWMVLKPFVTEASNCIFPDYVVYELLKQPGLSGTVGSQGIAACGFAYTAHVDPATLEPYTPYPYAPGHPYYYPGVPAVVAAYPGYDPLAGTVDPLTGTVTDPYTGQNAFNGHDYGPAPNNGEGFAKPLGGNQLPNAPHFTASFAAEYTMPVSEEWAASLHGDFYWQSQSMARVFNDRPYDKIRGYSTTNLALILTSASGWQVMGYVKNVFDVTAITGSFLNSDDSGLTTNIFLTDPRLYGVRVTRNW